MIKLLIQNYRLELDEFELRVLREVLDLAGRTTEVQNMLSDKEAALLASMVAELKRQPSREGNAHD